MVRDQLDQVTGELAKPNEGEELGMLLLSPGELVTALDCLGAGSAQGTLRGSGQVSGERLLTDGLRHAAVDVERGGRLGGGGQTQGKAGQHVRLMQARHATQLVADIHRPGRRRQHVPETARVRHARPGPRGHREAVWVHRRAEKLHRSGHDRGFNIAGKVQQWTGQLVPP